MSSVTENASKGECAREKSQKAVSAARATLAGASHSTRRLPKFTFFSDSRSLFHIPQKLNATVSVKMKELVILKHQVFVKIDLYF